MTAYGVTFGFTNPLHDVYESPFCLQRSVLTMLQAASNESADKVEQAFLLQLLQSLNSNKKEVFLSPLSNIV